MNDIIAKTRENYNRIAVLYAATRTSERELTQFADFITPNQTIFDWGCGNGRLVHLLKNQSVHYLGYDQSEAMIQVSREVFLPEITAGWVEFSDNFNASNYLESFDLVFLIASFHHLPDESCRLELLQNLYTTLKIGGKIIITVWNLESDWAQTKLQKDWQKINSQDYLIPWKDQAGQVMAERYYHHFTLEELGNLLTKVGFTILDNYYASGTTKVSPTEGRNLVFIAQK